MWFLYWHLSSKRLIILRSDSVSILLHQYLSPGHVTSNSFQLYFQMTMRTLTWSHVGNHQEYFLKKEMAAHSSILAWRIPWTRGAWKSTLHGIAKSQTWLKWLSMHPKNASWRKIKPLTKWIHSSIFILSSCTCLYYST